nr:hypothetical protein [Pyrinomonadaceae bacterium]
MGSGHQVYSDSSFAIPAIYLNDWPDRYIHTNFDTPANVDPTKLKRAAFIGAASAYFLANLKPEDASSILRASCKTRRWRGRQCAMHVKQQNIEFAQPVCRIVFTVSEISSQ